MSTPPAVRVAVVTGANRGLGLGTVAALARQGLTVVLTARTQAKAEEAAAPLRAEGLSVLPRALDVASDESVEGFFRWLDDEGPGRIDVLVNNAGTIFEPGDPAQPSLSTPDRVAPDIVLETFNNNTVGAYRMTRLALPRMNRQGYGRVVNVSSGMGALSDMGGSYPAYRMSKTGLNVWTLVFAKEADENVKVNSVCPGWVRTDMGGRHATRDLEEGVAGIVWAATLPDDGPSAGFFRDGERIDW